MHYCLILNFPNCTSLTQVLAETTNNQTTTFLPGIGQQTGENWRYYTSDGLGSTRQELSPDSTVTYAASYDPYGNLFEQYQVGLRPAFGYTGEQADANGLIYLRARYYDPRLGTFTTKDPFEGVMTRSGSLNGYSYVEGNPVNYTDPSGNCIGLAAGIDTLICVGIAALAGASIFATWDITVNQRIGFGIDPFGLYGGRHVWNTPVNWGQTGRAAALGALAGGAIACTVAFAACYGTASIISAAINTKVIAATLPLYITGMAFLSRHPTIANIGAGILYGLNYVDDSLAVYAASRGDQEAAGQLMAAQTLGVGPDGPIPAADMLAVLRVFGKRGLKSLSNLSDNIIRAASHLDEIVSLSKWADNLIKSADDFDQLMMLRAQRRLASAEAGLAERGSLAALGPEDFEGIGGGGEGTSRNSTTESLAIIRRLIDETDQQAVIRRMTLSRNQRSPVVTGVAHPLLKDVYFGDNHSVEPTNLPKVLEQLNNAYTIEQRALAPVQAGEPGTHSEIYALSEAIFALQRQLGRDITLGELKDFYLTNRYLRGPKLDVMDRCAHCRHLTDGVTVVGHE